ncbi:UDP-2,4-diacetamido-2,4,6-trideoxy-beta-L-altropyranose hydrolase [Paenibacillus piscarius]|uniref:UDP-2,4-diacetamido-2,4, 6-trideoxy-beta-L-altropyranose hydrolase n=1 Tax=Paenibacillus piscarius TaxID=1089681 RepID=UPI001EE838F4|nr:UDP-2,4-diacetamido-2,4,6-trideoxy-beta-L-altropyranose hydrolase [Paenibacillus piscarius]
MMHNGPVTEVSRPMQIFIRADSSYQMGTGHVMRCLTLAGELRQRGAEVTFICRDLPGNLAGYIRSKGYAVELLPQPNDPSYAAFWLQTDWRTDALETVQRLTLASPAPADCLIVDHYGIDRRWEQALSRHVHRLAVIDDLADRPHECSLLLDANASGARDRYQGLVPDSCVKLTGTGYTILRPEFRSAKQRLAERDGRVGRVLVFFGGTDPTGETLRALQALQNPAFAHLHLDVVLGGMNGRKEAIATRCSAMPNAEYHCQIDYIAELMRKADLSIGAGGSTTWERCYLGLPSLTIVTADNQREITALVHEQGAAYSLGETSDVTVQAIEQGLHFMLAHPAKVKEMSGKALQLMGEDRWDEVITRIIGGN